MPSAGSATFVWPVLAWTSLWLSSGLCSGCGVDAEVATAQLEGSVGVLHVERTLDAQPPGPTALGAAFARYRGMSAAAVLRLLRGRSAAELERCTYVGPDDGSGAAVGEVELLDVGTIRVQVADTVANLLPRAFPDVASVLAGVVYAGDAPLAVPRPEVDEYAFAAGGSPEVPAFEAVVPAPAELAGLRIDGAPAHDPVVIARDVGLDLAWNPGDVRDVVEFELRAHGDVLVCAARDDGSFRVDPDALAPLVPDAAATLLLRRVRTTPVDVPGLDDAFARIAVARELPAELR